MSNGWFKFYRNIEEWEWFGEPSTFRVFIQLLVKANYEESRHKGFNIKIGQLTTGRKILATQTGLSEQNVRTALKNLEKTNEISIQSTSKFSIISITNWHKYQSETSQPASNHQSTINQPSINQHLTINQPASNHQSTTLKETKKLRKKKDKEINNAKTIIPEDWMPNKKCIDFAIGKNFSQKQIDDLSEIFKIYWQEGDGRKSKKVNWESTFKIWLANDIKYHGNPELRDTGNSQIINQNGDRVYGNATSKTGKRSQSEIQAAKIKALHS